MHHEIQSAGVHLASRDTTPLKSSVLLAAIRSYFYSGWAFLIPYFLAYLVYAATGRSVHARAAVEHSTNGQAAIQFVPPLIHLFVGIHLAHAVLAIAALVAPYFLPAPHGSRATACTERMLPWALIFCLLLVAGAYFEWPADTWEHLRRVSEWSELGKVGEQSYGYKYSYVFTYSLVGWGAPEGLQRRLGVYQACAALLLLFQYYRLAITVGFDRRWALGATIANALCFGSSSFSFYRYYGISSTLYAQLGAVAFVRWAISAAVLCDNNARLLRRLAMGRTQSRKPYVPRPGSRCVFDLWAGPVVVAFIGVNHLQGLVLAGAGAAAVFLSHILTSDDSKRKGTVVVVAAIAVASSLALRHVLADYTRGAPAGWYNYMGGLSIYNPFTKSGNAVAQVAGVVGMFNFIAGLVLLPRNPLIGWLTILPVLVLVVPATAIPLMTLVSRTTDPVALQRILFAVPTPFALVYLLHREKRQVLRGFRNYVALPSAGAIPIVLSLITVISPGAFGWNRTWNLLSIGPADQALAKSWQAFGPYSQISRYSMFVGSAQISVLHSAWGLQMGVANWGRTFRTPSVDASNSFAVIEGYISREGSVLVAQVSPNAAYSAGSSAAALSHHWLSHEVALSNTGSREIVARCRALGYRVKYDQDNLVWFCVWPP